VACSERQSTWPIAKVAEAPRWKGASQPCGCEETQDNHSDSARVLHANCDSLSAWSKVGESELKNFQTQQNRSRIQQRFAGIPWSPNQGIDSSEPSRSPDDDNGVNMSALIRTPSSWPFMRAQRQYREGHCGIIEILEESIGRGGVIRRDPGKIRGISGQVANWAGNKRLRTGVGNKSDC
jgi:hypothetical protein